MTVKDYFMEEIWPLLDEEQKRRLVFVASLMAQFPPPPVRDSQTA